MLPRPGGFPLVATLPGVTETDQRQRHPGVANEPAASGDSALRTFVGLFVVPLGVVGTCVGIFLLFGWLAGRSAGVDAWIADLDDSWRPRRAQAAYELSKAVTADPAVLADTGRRRAVRERFLAADDPRQRGYLALVLARAGDPKAVPMVLEALPGAAGEEEIYLLVALGISGEGAGRATLLERLGSDDPGVRKSAAWALGELGRDEMGVGESGAPREAPGEAPREGSSRVSTITALERRLGDPVADVRWNAALALARLGSDAGAPTLLEILDRDRTDAVPGLTPDQQEGAMVATIPALAAVAPGRAVPVLEALIRDDPSGEVRRTAREALTAVLDTPGDLQ